MSAASLDEAIHMARKQVSKWVAPAGGNLRPDQNAILTGPGTKSENWPDKAGNVAITEDFEEWRAGDAILRSTWARFKGLEADAVVMVEDPSKYSTKANRYVATSRAKHLLTVVRIENVE
jgi:hypothetical protein